jgi:hypothetical protein
MSLVNLFVDPAGIINALDAQTHELRRIADAIEYILPRSAASDPVPPVPPEARPPIGFTFAETPEQYQLRLTEERNFGLSLGLAQWSPELQSLILKMRYDLMLPKVEYDEAGNPAKVEGKSEEEANSVIEEAFKLAKAAAATTVANEIG